jgi:hypothetical protein
VPAYKAGFDGVTRSQYVGIRGVAFAPNGDLYVADDPTASLVLPVLPTKQGNLEGALSDRTAVGLTYAPASGLKPAAPPLSSPEQVSAPRMASCRPPSERFRRKASRAAASQHVPSSRRRYWRQVVPLIVNASAQTVTAGSFSFIPSGVGGNPPTITSIS